MWEISTREQLLTVAVSVLCGCILCVLYDILRASRKAGAGSFAAVFAGDVLFFVVAAVAVFFVCLARTCGEIRGYILFAAALGFVLFRATFSKITFYIFTLLFRLCAAAKGLLSRLLMKFARAVKGILMFLAPLAAIIPLYCKKVLKNARGLLYNKEKYEKAGENTDDS